jgi:transposase
LRELEGIKERTGQKWTEGMQELLLGLKKEREAGEEGKEGSLPEEILREAYRRYDELIEEGLKENPKKEREEGQKGRVKQSKAYNLLIRLREHKMEWLRFAYDFRAPFDNNQAERDFRIAKVKTKVSGSFRSEGGGTNYGRLQTIIQTVKKHGESIYNELIKLFCGNYSFSFALGE